MRISLIDAGALGPDGRYDDYAADLVSQFEQGGHTVGHLRIPELKVHLCSGCWSCWIKTPGLCSQQDDSAQVLPYHDCVFALLDRSDESSAELVSHPPHYELTPV